MGEAFKISLRVEVFMNFLAGAAQFGLPRPGDQVDAAKEFCKAGAGNLVINAEAPLLGDKETGPLHDGEMLGEGRDIAACLSGQIIHTLLPLHEGLHDQEPCGVGHRLDHACPQRGVGFQLLQLASHIWYYCQIIVPRQVPKLEPCFPKPAARVRRIQRLRDGHRPHDRERRRGHLTQAGSRGCLARQSVRDPSRESDRRDGRWRVGER